MKYIIIYFILIFLFIYSWTTTPETFENNNDYKIPKFIHQTFPGKKGDPLPKKVEENIKYIKKNNPNWNYILYRDDEIETFIKKNYSPNIYKTFKKIKKEYGPARSDYFRYLVIYKLGGVYLDIKSAADKPLDDIIHKNDTYILSHWQYPQWPKLLKYPHGEFQQWHIIAAPKHPFLKKIIKNVTNKINNYNNVKDGTGKYGVLKLTGPIIYTKTIIPLLEKHRHRIFHSNAKAGLVYDNIGNYLKLFKNHYSNINIPIVDNHI